MLYTSIAVYARQMRERPDFPHPLADLKVFWISLVSAFLTVIFRALSTKMLWSVIAPHVKDRNDTEVHEKRVDKMVRALEDTVYMTVMTIYAISFLKQSPWLPWYMGGEGKTGFLFKDAPWTIPEEGAATYALI